MSTSPQDEPLPGTEQQPELFEVEENWRSLWKGMPEFEQKDLASWQTLLVHFRSPADRESFSRIIGQSLNTKTQYVWHPKAKIEYVADKCYVSTTPVNPRYPVYVPTKGRWDSALTIKALERLGVPYFAVVQPQEKAHYEAVVKTGTFLLLPAGLDGLVPARNWIFEHAKASGARRHWQIDDNIRDFYRMHDNQKIRVGDGTIFRCMEDFADRYENVAIAGPQYEMFAPRRQEIPPFVLNTRVYSCSLISCEMEHRYRDVYNDDTDICLRALKAGMCTVQFNAFLAKKMATMLVKGGNTPIYLGAEAVAAEWVSHAAACKLCDVDVSPTCDAGRAILQKDGRWRMAASLLAQHPDVTTVVRKWDRWQHHVDYRRFRDNALIARPGAVMDVDYGFKIDAAPASWGKEARDDEDAVVAPAQAPAQAKPVTREPTAAGPSALDFVLSSKPPEVPWQAPPAAVQAPKPEALPLEPTAATGQPEPAPEPSKAEAPEPGPTGFKADLLARGHRLMTRDGKLFISEASRLSDENRARIKACRDELLTLATPWLHEPSPTEQAATVELVQAVAIASEGETQAERANDAAPGVGSYAATFFDSTPAERGQSLATFLGSEPPRVDLNYVPDEPPDLSGVDEIVLNFATTGLDWHKKDRPVGVTVSSLDGQLCRFLPFGFRGGGNLDEAAVKRWAQEQLKGKRITNAKTKFDIHHAREWGVDLEAQGCTFSDVQHTAALLDDHRKKFALDILAADYLPGIAPVLRVDESRHADYAASEAAERERYTALTVTRLVAAFRPQLEAEELLAVQTLEDSVIPAVVEMEKNGSPIDMALLEQYGRECNAEHDRLMLEIAQECGFSFDHTASGWKRLIDSLCLTPPDSFSEASLNEVDHPLIRKGQKAAQYASLHSKIFGAYPKHIVDGILRYNINQLVSDEGGTVSGRFSIGLVQQVPNRDNHEAAFGSELFPRRLFIPGQGLYLEADAMQIEQRLLVHYMNNATIIKEYDGDYDRLMRGEDPVSFHKVTWAMLKQYKADMLYSHVKSFNFAFAYGAKSIKLAVMMGFITEAEGDEIRMAKRWNDPRLKTIKEIEAAYRKMLPECGALLDRAAHLAKPACDDFCKKSDALHRRYKHRGYVKTIFGRRARFSTNYKVHSALNRILQGNGADCLKRKLVDLHQERKTTGFVLRMTVHDSVNGDATQPDTKSLVSAILNKQNFPVPVLFDCKTGLTWADCK